MKTINWVKIGLIVLVLSIITTHIFQSIYVDISFETFMYYFCIVSFILYSACFLGLLTHVLLNWVYGRVMNYFNVK